MSKSKEKAIVLLSGGLDSSVVLASIATQYDCHALTVNYGQKAQFEIKAATKIAKLYAKDHFVFSLKDLGQFKTSSLTSMDIPIEFIEKINDSAERLSTYVPGRNFLFLSVCLSWAISIKAKHIFIGIHSDDSRNYPDCSEEFICAFQAMADASTFSEDRAQVHAPLAKLNKKQIIQKAKELRLDISQTVSCYQPTDDGHVCNVCLSCALRNEALAFIE